MAKPDPSRRLSSLALGALAVAIAAPCPSAAAPLPQEPTSPAPAPRSAVVPEPPGEQWPLPTDEAAERSGAPIHALTLADALLLGRESNVRIKAAEVLPQQARLDLLFAEAGFTPEVYGSSGYAKGKSPRRSAFSPSLASETIDAKVGWRQRVLTGGLFDLAFTPTRFESDGGGGAFPSRQYTALWAASFRQPLLRGGWSDYNLAATNSARLRQRQAENTYDRTVQDTLLEIVNAYWELAFARQNWRVVTSSLAVAEEQLRITIERIRVEELAPRDVIADKAEVARRTEEQITAENEIKNREDELRRLLFDGADSSIWHTNLRTVSPIEVEPRDELRSFEALVEIAAQNRPDLRAQRNAVAAAEVALVETETDTLPQLDLIGSYSSDGVSSFDATNGTDASFSRAVSDASNTRYPDWSVRLEFAIPIGNQAARSRAQKARLEVERQRRLLHAAMLDVTKDVRDAVRRLGTLTQSIRASGESVRLAESNLETERVKLRVGASTAFEVQRRNQELREARSRHLRNQLDYRAAESRLLHVQGLLRATDG